MIGNRTKRTVGKAKVPTVVNGEDRGFISCCDPFLTLASLTEDDRYYNDVNLVFQKLYSEDDSASFVLIKDGEEIEPSGVAVSFVNGQLVSGFEIEWRNHLATTGVGCYDVRCDFNINGVEGSYIYRKFDLQHWTVETSEETVRMLSIYNDYSRKWGIDFTGSGCVDTIRFMGFFGKMAPNFSVTNHTSVGFERRKVENEANKSYQLSVFHTTECYTSRIIEEHLLHANEIYISDHNAANHNKATYRDFPVILKSDSTPEMDYPDGSDYASISAVFEDKIADSASHFNGELATNTKVILELLAGAASAPSCPPAKVTLNGSNFITVQAGGTENITIVDQDGNTIVPESVTGPEITIEMVSPQPTGERVPVNTVTDPNTQILWYGQSGTVTTSTGQIEKTSGDGSYNGDASFEIATLGDFILQWRYEGPLASIMGFSFINYDTSFERVEYSLSAQPGDTILALSNSQLYHTLNGIPDPSVALMEIRVLGREVQFWWDGVYQYTWPMLLPTQHGYVTFDCSMVSVGTKFTDIKVIYL